MRILKLLILTMTFVQCTTHPHHEGREEYIEKISRYSAGDKQFAGLYHNFEFRATLLTEKVSRLIHDRLQQYYAWGPQESSEKLQERLSKLEDSTRMWLSFFTTDRKNDNLAKQNSIWKIYLVANGTRYEGRAIKANESLAEAKAIFPYHNRWTTPYYIEFPVPSADITNGKVQLIITGPLGRREVSFPTL